MDRLEKKFGKYAIPRLTMVLLVIQAVGYAMYYMGMTELFTNYLTLNPHQILRGQIWRLFTWLLIPSMDLFSFVLTSMLFYLPIGSQMERVWGDFRYNLYIFLGLVFTVLGSFLLYLYYYVSIGSEGVAFAAQYVSVAFSPYYVMMSIFFAFAATFPDSMVLFMFLVPLKMKWLGMAYGAFMLYSIIRGTAETRIVIISSILNFVVFFLWAQKNPFGRSGTAQRTRQQARNAFQRATRMQPGQGAGAQGSAWNRQPGGGTAMQPRHRCAVCGVTDLSNPDYEFRYCSKCNGAYEYCQEHLFTHTHVQ